MIEDDYDVVVVGGGGAGMAAAIAASNDGARVLLVESEGALGGSTALSGGIVLAAGTRVQAEAGIVGDGPDALYHDYTSVNRWRVDPAIAWTLCEHASSALDWLIGFGVRFPVELLHRTGMDPIRRAHRAEGHGAAIATALERACRSRDIDVALGRRVRRLVRDGDRVAGVATADEEVSAAAVVVASGGFGQSPDLLAAHYPTAVASGWTWSVAAPGSRGDALALAEAVGARLDGADRGLVIAATGLARASQHLPGWLVHVDPTGRRFVDESSYLSVLAQRIVDVGGECFALLDHAARLRGGAQPAFGDLLTGGDATWTPQLARQAAEGLVFRGETVRELAASAGLDPSVLEATVTRYNEDCATGVDRSFRKDASALWPLATPPYYAVRVRPAVVALTGYGVRIDADARVLDVLDRPVPGLFAAGEATGNVLGEIYLGSGNSIASAIVFGRIAGRQAASER